MSSNEPDFEGMPFALADIERIFIDSNWMDFPVTCRDYSLVVAGKVKPFNTEENFAVASGMTFERAKAMREKVNALAMVADRLVRGVHGRS